MLGRTACSVKAFRSSIDGADPPIPKRGCTNGGEFTTREGDAFGEARRRCIPKNGVVSHL